MKRHYTKAETGYQCCACRARFSTTKDLAKHVGKGGTCKHPDSLGFYVDIDVSPHQWTSKKPECYKAA